MWKVDAFHRIDSTELCPTMQRRFERIQARSFAFGRDFDRPVRQIPRVSPEGQLHRLALHKPPEPHTLHPATNHPAAGSDPTHFPGSFATGRGGRRRCHHRYTPVPKMSAGTSITRLRFT